MTAPLQRPRRKNPVLRTPQPTLPPAGRSRVALGLLFVKVLKERLSNREDQYYSENVEK